MIDISFDLRSDTPPGKDPDKFSSTLREYHRRLWSKPLPDGASFELKISKAKGYLFHQSSIGEFYLSSDAMMPSYLNIKRMAAVLEQVPKSLPKEVQSQAYRIGGFIVFPGNRIDNKMTINGARGCNRKIGDRFDLTLECIRRHYAQQESPLSEVLQRYGYFFEIFRSFRDYTEFFHLQDLVSQDASEVKFLLAFDNFQRTPFPISGDEYRAYAERTMGFLKARGARMKAAVNN